MQINDWWYDVHRQLTFKILPTPRNTSWNSFNLSHLVFVRLLHVAEFALETQNIDLIKQNIQIQTSKLTAISKSRSLTFRVFGFMVKTPVTSSPFLLVM